MSKSLLPVLFLIFLAAAAQAQTYYVAKSGCSDSGSGTEPQPWCTLTKAGQSAMAGDTVLIKAGTYTEPLVPANSGTAGNYIYFKNFGNDAPVITYPPGGEWSFTVSGSIYSEFDFAGRVTPAIDLSGKNFIWIEGLKIQNVGAFLWSLKGNSNVIKGNTFIEALNGCCSDGLLFMSSNDNKIEGNYIEGAGDDITMVDCMRTVVQGNELRRGDHVLFTIKCGKNNIVRKNFLYNETQKIGEMLDCWPGDTPHFSTALPCESHLIENNFFAYDPPCIGHSPYNGIQFAAQKSIIRKNIFKENTGGAIGMSSYGGEAKNSSYNRIYNNVFYKNHFGAIQIPSTDGSGATFLDNIFRNNIIYKNDFVDYDGRWDAFAALNGKPIQIWTNRILPGYLFEKNVIFHSQPGEEFTIGGSRTSAVCHSLSWYQSNYPALYKNNLETDPLFLNPEGNDFNLASDSPLIDAGVFLAKTVSAGSGTLLQLDDVFPFFDGFGIPGETPDIIQLEGQAQTAAITSINYATKTISLTTSLFWTAGQGVSLAYSGSAPDIGAVEFSGPILCGGTECSSGQICCNGICTRSACTPTTGCLTGQQCINPSLCNAQCQNINCPEGAINTACYCQGSARTTGYCCSGTYRATVCTHDVNCNDNNAATKDTCNAAGTCNANCTRTTITQCINNDGYCPPTCTKANDNDCLASCGNGSPDVNENCSNCPQDVNCSSGKICCNATCITPECSTDANCSSGQHCSSPDPCTGQCIDCNKACDNNTQCNDNNTATIDSCENPASCDSYCKNEPVTCGGTICNTGQICCNNTCTTPTCTTSSQCNDNDACTRDSCTTAGTCTAQCSNTEIPKCGWKKMSWTTPSCFPIAALFTVTIKDETGALLEGVEITYGTQKMFTNAEGKVEMLGEKSKYVVNATKEAYYPLTARKLASTTCKPTYTTTGTTTTPAAKGKIKIEVLETPYVGREFSIKITDNNSQPLQGATITYSNQTAQTNEQGTATLTGEKSKYTITATSDKGTATTRILPRTYIPPDQNTSSNGGAAKPFTIPLDITALAAVVIVGVIVLLRSRVSNKKAPVS